MNRLLLASILLVFSSLFLYSTIEKADKDRRITTTLSCPPPITWILYGPWSDRVFTKLHLGEDIAGYISYLSERAISTRISGSVSGYILCKTLCFSTLIDILIYVEQCWRVTFHEHRLLHQVGPRIKWPHAITRFMIDVSDINILSVSTSYTAIIKLPPWLSSIMDSMPPFIRIPP